MGTMNGHWAFLTVHDCPPLAPPLLRPINMQLTYFDLLFGSRSLADFLVPLGDIAGGGAIFDPLAGGEADELEEVYNVNCTIRCDRLECA